MRAQADCRDIRLDAKGAMSSLPVFDQANASGDRDMNLCYAVAAAQLLDASKFGMKKIAQSEMTSPWWLAVNYSMQFKRQGDSADVGFGETDKALESAKQSGVCSQADLFGDHKNEEIMDFHGKLKKVFSGSERESKLQSLLRDFRFLTDPKQLAEVSGKVLKAKNFISFLQLLFQEKCQGKVQQEPSFEVQRMDLDRKPISADEKQSLIEQTLQSQQPLEASICSQALRNPDYQGLSDNGKFARDCMRHSVLILGSRDQGGQCQYLVRDTYGTESCQRKYKGSSWYHSSLQCESGQVWVPEKVLFANTWGVTRVLRVQTDSETSKSQASN
jgi:hypothetical protein